MSEMKTHHYVVVKGSSNYCLASKFMVATDEDNACREAADCVVRWRKSLGATAVMIEDTRIAVDEPDSWDVEIDYYEVK